MKNNRLIFLCLLLFGIWTHAQTIRYVKQGGTGSGTSWATASGDIQAMINASSTGDEVRVAAGTYKPNRPMDNVNNIYTGTDTHTLCKRAFVLKAGVKLAGGYLANASTSNQVYRPLENPTILSGDFAGNDTTNTSTVTISGNTKNAYSVVVITGSANQAFHLQGVHVEGGNANTAG